MALCKGCRQPIDGNNENTVRALNNHWHADCLNCHGCKKSLLNQKFIQYDNQPFHPQCLKCPGCLQPIKDAYIHSRGQPWHPPCYQHQNRPRCDICRKPLAKHYLSDFWGNRFCENHQHYTSCSSCGRLICQRITGGGVVHPDGFALCNLCNLRGVITQEQGDRILNQMKKALSSIGLDLNQAETPLKLCGRDELRKTSRHNFHNERPVLGIARWSKTLSGGQVVSRTFQDILIQKNLPEEHFQVVAIHELTHAWFFYHNFRDLPLEIEEGFCVLMEYIWLQQKKE